MRDKMKTIALFNPNSGSVSADGGERLRSALESAGVRGAEILQHCRRIAEHYDLYRDALLHTEVHEIRWDADLSRWLISTDRGDCIRARFVSLANGYIHKPKLPGIPGIGEFAGKTFHTSRWDYDYTGEHLEHLADQRVGIIGLGIMGSIIARARVLAASVPDPEIPVISILELGVVRDVRYDGNTLDEVYPTVRKAPDFAKDQAAPVGVPGIR